MNYHDSKHRPIGTFRNTANYIAPLATEPASLMTSIRVIIILNSFNLILKLEALNPVSGTIHSELLDCPRITNKHKNFIHYLI